MLILNLPTLACVHALDVIVQSFMRIDVQHWRHIHSAMAVVPQRLSEL